MRPHTTDEPASAANTTRTDSHLSKNDCRNQKNFIHRDREHGRIFSLNHWHFAIVAKGQWACRLGERSRGSNDRCAMRGPRVRACMAAASRLQALCRPGLTTRKDCLHRPWGTWCCARRNTACAVSQQVFHLNQLELVLPTRVTPTHSLNRTHCCMRLKARHFILGLYPHTATVRLAQKLGRTNHTSAVPKPSTLGNIYD